MDQYILHGETQLPPVVVVMTLLFIATFVIGFGYQLLGLVMSVDGNQTVTRYNINNQSKTACRIDIFGKSPKIIFSTSTMLRNNTGTMYV